MNIEVKDLMDENEMLSHIFLGCIPKDQLKIIKDKFVKDVDWRKESVKLPVEMKIGGVDVNPKEFFDNWKEQMQELINKSATKLLSKQFGAVRMSRMIEQMQDMQEVLKSWEEDINWEVENPLEK